MIAEHERLVLTADLPEHGLEAVEGETAAVATVKAAHARPLGRRDITHARAALAA